MWPSGELAAKHQRGRRIIPRYSLFSLSDLAWVREVAWLCFPSRLPAVLGSNQIFAWCHRGSVRGGALGAGLQIPLPNTRVCNNCTSSLMFWKRKPTEINIDISRVMKQLQSWFINVSPHFVACLHLQRGRTSRRCRGGETSWGEPFVPSPPS